MTVADLIARARSQIGKKTIYKLGAGGMKPGAPGPQNDLGQCDCSGFACWCLGISRMTDHPLYHKFNGGWINTDAIVMDAKWTTGFFDGFASPTAGCLIVYPSKKPARAVGHVGIVSAVKDGKVTKVIHCGSGNYRTTGDAIQETPPTVFAVPDIVYAWYAGLE